MKRIYFFLLILPFFALSQTPSWSWAKGAGGNLGQTNSSGQSVLGTNIATDLSGNVYTVGYFETPTLSIGSFNLVNSNSSGNKPEIFIVKYDPSGNVIWAKSAQGDSSDVAAGIAVDNAYNIYITGDFASPTLSFGPITITNTANGTDDIFLVKYDANGNVIWAKSWGGNKDDNGVALAKDNIGAIYLTGNFASSSITLGPNTLSFDTASLQNMYLAKLDTSGNVIYAKIIGKGCYIPVTSQDLATDPNNNVYIVGMFAIPQTVIGFDTLICNANSSNYFISKLDPSGNFLWTKSASGSNYTVIANAIAIDVGNNPCIMGYFSGNSMTIGTTTLASTCCYTGYVAKYSSSGNALWAKNTLVNNPVAGWPWGCITTDSNYGIYIGGGFFNQVNGLPPLVFGNDTLLNGNSGFDAIYIAKYDSAGNDLWGKTATSIRWNVVTGLVTDRYDNIYCVGEYCSPTFILDSDTLYNQNAGLWTMDYFAAKIGNVGVGISTFTNSSSLIIYPNPSSRAISIKADKPIEYLSVTDTFGQTVGEYKPNTVKFTLQVNVAGIYFITIQSGMKKMTRKIIITQ